MTVGELADRLEQTHEVSWGARPLVIQGGPNNETYTVRCLERTIAGRTARVPVPYSDAINLAPAVAQSILRKLGIDPAQYPFDVTH